MATSTLTVCILGLIVCLCLQASDASLCQPNSKFKYDCNTCTCSSTGREFSCTNTICAPLIYKDKYLIEQNEKGYSILKPKTKNLDDDKKLSGDNDLFVNDQPIGEKFKRAFFKKMPYIKRPIPSGIVEDYADYDGQISKSSEEDIEAEDVNNDYDDRKEEDEYSDEDLATYGRVPQNRLY